MTSSRTTCSCSCRVNSLYDIAQIPPVFDHLMAAGLPRLRCMAADRPTLFRCCADQLAERRYDPRPAPFRRRFEACLQAGSFRKERLSRLRRAALAGVPAADATFPAARQCLLHLGRAACVLAVI